MSLATPKASVSQEITQPITGFHRVPAKSQDQPALFEMGPCFRNRLEKAQTQQDLSYFTTGEGKEAKVWFNSGKPTRLVASFHGNAGPDIKKFWYSQDCTPENLIEKVTKSTLVAIDIGNHQSETALDVGIAILPAFPDYLLDSPLEEGVADLSRYNARIHNFRTPYQGPSAAVDFEPLRFGSEEIVEAKDIERRLVMLLQLAKKEADSLGNEFVLVLFCAGGDLKAIIRSFPKIIPLFAWWTDIQAIVTKMMTGSAEKDAPRRASPSLGETLAALGHRTLSQGGTSQRLSKHKSSHDAARTIAVVAGVVRALRAGEKLTIREPRNPGSTSTRKVHTNRPRPAEMFPFVANIKMEEGICPTPREYRGCRSLWDVFAAYKPNGVGRRICNSNSKDWFDRCKGRCGACIWISVPTRKLVEQLLKDFHGKQMKDGLLVVKDTSLPVRAELTEESCGCR